MPPFRAKNGAPAKEFAAGAPQVNQGEGSTEGLPADQAGDTSAQPGDASAPPQDDATADTASDASPSIESSDAAGAAGAVDGVDNAANVESTSGVVVHLAHLRAPAGSTSVSIGGEEYSVDEQGVVQVPEQHIATLREMGFTIGSE